MSSRPFLTYADIVVIESRIHATLRRRPRGGAPAPYRRRLPRGPGRTGAHGLVEPQRAGECLEHARRSTLRVPVLQPGVVVDADPGQHRDFLPAESGHPPVAAVC